MAREGSLGKLLKELALAPWWVGVTVSAVVYVGLSMMLPMFADGPVTELVSGLGAPLAVLLLIPAAVSALRDWKGRRMLVGNRRKESFRALGWQEFEELIEAHYRSAGYRIRRETRGGPDGGVDVRLQAMDGRAYLVQCKQWRARSVGVKVVRELFGVVSAEGAAGGIVVTTGSFTPEAERFAQEIAIDLVDGDRLESMLQPVEAESARSGYEDEEPASAVCPRCGSGLVLRRARRGPTAGSSFYGCSSYPKCRFTRPG